MFAFVSQLFSSPLYFGLISSSPNPLQAKPEEVLIDKELKILDQTEGKSEEVLRGWWENVSLRLT